MKLDEFKLWLDGFCAAIPDAPTADQFATLKAKLAAINAQETVTLKMEMGPPVVFGIPRIVPLEEQIKEHQRASWENRHMVRLS